nr:DUF3800 domain-containing protein [Blastococcus sp. Marseille-P5729]
MHVFIDDSGDGGLKIGQGSTSHLVMAACIFRDPFEIQRLAAQVAVCRTATRHTREFKYSSTKESVKDAFFAHVATINFDVRAIVIDKAKIYSTKLRSEPQALKAYALRMLLTKNFGQITDAKIIIDGQDTKAFGVQDSEYLTRMVNRETPGTIATVKFDDSRANIGIQLADMIAGAINRGCRTHKKANPKHLALIRPRTYYPTGTLWHFCK